MKSYLVNWLRRFMADHGDQVQAALSASPSPPVQERQEAGGGEFKPDWTLTETERAIVALSLALPKHVPGWPGCTDEQMEAVATAVLSELHRETQSVGGEKLHHSFDCDALHHTGPCDCSAERGAVSGQDGNVGNCALKPTGAAANSMDGSID